MDVALNSNSIIEMYLNGIQIYTNALWYGVKFAGNATTGTRTGNTLMHKNLPVQSNMKGCTITAEGIVKYLNPTDWTHYEDGTEIDSTLNVMVEIPDHSIQFIAEGDSVEIRMSPYRLPGFEPVKLQYVSAYEAYNDSSVLKSKKGVNPTVSTTRDNFQAYARANGNAHWNMYTYQAHKAITWLFVVEYANRNCQAAYNASLTAEGYHQGGLGEGVTTGTITVSGATVYNYVPTGTTDSLGNNSGIVEYTTTTADETQRTVNVPRYRGIENPFGHIWKNVYDVKVSGTDNSVYLVKDIITESYESQSLKEVTTTGYVTQLTNNNAGDLFPTAVGGSVSTYWCDYHYTNPVETERTLRLGGHSANGATAGLFNLYSSNGLGSSAAHVGSRLIYIL